MISKLIFFQIPETMRLPASDGNATNLKSRANGRLVLLRRSGALSVGLLLTLRLCRCLLLLRP